MAPEPSEPTTTVSPRYSVAAKAELGVPPVAMAEAVHVVPLGDVHSVAVGMPPAEIRVPNATHGWATAGAMIAEIVVPAPPPTARAAALERSHEYGDGA